MGILAVRDADKREILAAVWKVQENQKGMEANVINLQSLATGAVTAGQLIAEIKARQQINEHRIDVLEDQMRHLSR